VSGYDRKAGVDPTDDLDQFRARGLGPASTLIDFGAGAACVRSHQAAKHQLVLVGKGQGLLRRGSSSPS
jgi:hypothetical protein